MNHQLPTTNSGTAGIFNHIRKGLRQNSIIRASVLGQNPNFPKNFYSFAGNHLRAIWEIGLRENSAQTRNLL